MLSKKCTARIDFTLCRDEPGCFTAFLIPIYTIIQAEFKALIDAGFSAREALQAGTINGGQSGDSLRSNRQH